MNARLGLVSTQLPITAQECSYVNCDWWLRVTEPVTETQINESEARVSCLATTNHDAEMFLSELRLVVAIYRSGCANAGSYTEVRVNCLAITNHGAEMLSEL